MQLILNVVLFGPIGLTIWAVQMLWIPIFAAGVINGIGHYWGYRNFSADDASRNIVPWGILIGGEELHNNHHAYATSARLSSKWYEFDIGWAYIRIMEMLGLAKVKKLAPPVRMEMGKSKVDYATLHAVITHRYDVLARYARSLKDTWMDEARKRAVDRASVKRWLHSDERQLPHHDRARLNELLANSKVLATTHSMRQELAQVWQRSTATKEQLVKQLEDWCHRAELSGIAPLQEFSKQLRSYA
jgi:stearoyl-CoA desaturase (delta-9 desaturase)